MDFKIFTEVEKICKYIAFVDYYMLLWSRKSKILSRGNQEDCQIEIKGFAKKKWSQWDCQVEND